MLLKNGTLVNGEKKDILIIDGKIAEIADYIDLERAKKLFKTDYHFNVQPYSGSPANLAAILAICNPGDTIMGLELS